MEYFLYISCPIGTNDLLSQELISLGFTIEKIHSYGISGKASLSCIYDLAIWSRIANRIHLVLFKSKVEDAESLYKACQSFEWDKVFSPTTKLWIDFYGQSETLRHTIYSAQIIKDSIVDFMKFKYNLRPSVTKEDPEITLIAHLDKNELTVSVDLVGFSLHQRGYRKNTGLAPIKENIAAALLMRAKISADLDLPVIDPFCGSGTIVIEAALIKANKAPGLIRNDQHFKYWCDHDEQLWLQRRLDAKLKEQPVDELCYGFDCSTSMINNSIDNARLAGVADLTKFSKLNINNLTVNSLLTNKNGIIVTNPPYGERLDDQDLRPLYENIGKIFYNNFSGWYAFVLTAHSELARAIGLRSHKKNSLYNGALPCGLYHFNIDMTNKLKDHNLVQVSSEINTMIYNRLKKRLAHLKKWSKRNNVTCYRLYDADLPEYSFAVDLYSDKVAVVQEYKAPTTISIANIERHKIEFMQALKQLLNIKIIFKTRSQQKGIKQYNKLSNNNNRFVVNEGSAKFYINADDYLDTGLFLDHRKLRTSFAAIKPKINFLNCFCYTATASVHAAIAGATTTNVDLSNTYLNWAKENFYLNNINLDCHKFIRDDCRSWLKNCRDKFDLIFLDPPSFSNSKSMDGILNLKEDHYQLIIDAMNLLNKNGSLYFSTNLRNFKLSKELHTLYQIKNITDATIDEDFKQGKPIHHCFLIKFPNSLI